MSEPTPSERPVPLVNPANAITLVRLLTTPFFVWAVLANNKWAIIGTYLGGSFIDLFDGMVARRFHCVTNFGANFDATVDAIFYTAAFIVLAAVGTLPVFWVVLLFAGAFANMMVRAWYAHTEGKWVNYRSYASEIIGGGASGIVLTAVTGFRPELFIVPVAIMNLFIPPFDIVQIRRLRRAQAAEAGVAEAGAAEGGAAEGGAS